MLMLVQIDIRYLKFKISVENNYMKCNRRFVFFMTIFVKPCDDTGQFDGWLLITDI